jgi:proteasome lid subunit RPN8/RPN11
MAEPIENNISPPEDPEENQIKLGTFELPDPARVIIPTMLPVAASLLWEPKDLVIRSEQDVSPNPDIAIFVTQEVLHEVQQHLKSGGAHEHAGFLLGNRHRCPESRREFVLIDNRVEAQYTQTTPLSVTFTFDTWARFKDELENKFRGKMAAGWYHSHPNLGVLLSPDDTGLHSQWFSQPFMSALVIDPVAAKADFSHSAKAHCSPVNPSHSTKSFHATKSTIVGQQSRGRTTGAVIRVPASSFSHSQFGLSHPRFLPRTVRRMGKGQTSWHQRFKSRPREGRGGPSYQLPPR